MNDATSLDFDTLTFRPMTLRQWKQRYQGVIRISCSLMRIRKALPGLHLATKQTKMYLVQYDKGDWRDGIPQKVSVGTTPMLVRVPAIKVGKAFLLIDGCHRLKTGPAFVVLDYLDVPASERNYLTDLYNPNLNRMTRSGRAKHV
jgi:hypothetical protein